MSYKLKGQYVIINGQRQFIVPSTLPTSPADGYFAVDSADQKFKVWNQAKNRWIVFGDAVDIVFNNATNGYVSTNVQAAIEESKNIAILKPRFSITTTFNGIISNNDWLGYSELIPGNQVPIRIPLNCYLKEVTVSYRNANLLGIPLGGDLIDGRLQIYQNGFTDPTNVIHTETFTNQADGKVISGLNIHFNANDFIVSRWKDDGDNPSDMAIVYFFQIE